MQVLIQGNQVAIVAKFLLGKWQETLRGVGTIFGCSDFRDRLGWQALLMIGRWYLLPPTQTIPQIVSPKTYTHSI